MRNSMKTTQRLAAATLMSLACALGGMTSASATTIVVSQETAAGNGIFVELGTIDVLCGEDAQIADCMQVGAKGVIGVLSNLVPHRVLDLVEASGPGGDAGRAATLVEHLAPLARALFLEPNPAPLKAALERLGWCSGELRLPLLPVEGEAREELTRTLDALGLNA